MSKCDGCGKPIGHASTIEGVYEGDELEKDHYYFGDSECKRIFEEKKGVEEKIECHDCGKVVLREEAKAPTRTVSGIRVAPETCKDCAEEVTEDGDELVRKSDAEDAVEKARKCERQRIREIEDRTGEIVSTLSRFEARQDKPNNYRDEISEAIESLEELRDDLEEQDEEQVTSDE